MIGYVTVGTNDLDKARAYLAEAGMAGGFETTFTTSMGRVSKVRIVHGVNDDTVEISTAPDGTVSSVSTLYDGRSLTEAADGTTTTMQYAPDPRFGMAAPFVSSWTTSTGAVRRP